jgi:2-amino-4-hydroxy-6-hydroxymethyldihydropteridine diphosphokinase
MRAWVGLGGNHEDSRAVLSAALTLIGDHPDISLLRCSRMYRSRPWGVSGQADFINAVAELETGLSPADLLQSLLSIENQLGRVRDGQQWGPRCIDLDLLACEELILKSKDLELPHPFMHLRAFVLVPLLELEPEFRIPGVGKAQHELELLGRRELESVQLFADETQESPI